MYLVMLRHSQDDLPIKLLADKDEAIEFAQWLNWFPEKRITDLFRIDCTTPIIINVIEFNADGEPSKIVFKRPYEDDGDSPPVKDPVKPDSDLVLV